MSTTKDKLSSSVRQAKAVLQQKTEETTPAAPPSAESTKAKAKPKPPATKQKTDSTGTVPESSGILFPERVWPD